MKKKVWNVRARKTFNFLEQPTFIIINERLPKNIKYYRTCKRVLHIPKKEPSSISVMSISA